MIKGTHWDWPWMPKYHLPELPQRNRLCITQDSDNGISATVTADTSTSLRQAGQAEFIDLLYTHLLIE